MLNPPCILFPVFNDAFIRYSSSYDKRSSDKQLN